MIYKVGVFSYFNPWLTTVSLPYLNMLLLFKSHLSNQHIEIVLMFLESKDNTPIFVLFWGQFTNEASSDHPQLFNDLKEGRKDTLKDYVID